MDKPFKIIFKYKNINGVYQYNPYIFIGNISNNIYSILNKFNKLPFITTLKTLSIGDIKTLTDFYGEKWYSYFFIYNHLEYSIKNISNSDKKNIQSKMSPNWINTHFNIKNLHQSIDNQVGGNKKADIEYDSSDSSSDNSDDSNESSSDDTSDSSSENSDNSNE